jgi:hypothetical protein
MLNHIIKRDKMNNHIYALILLKLDMTEFMQINEN